MYACNASCSTTKSHRGETLCHRKITRALARIKLGLQDCLFLGNMDAKTRLGTPQDYVEMQWLMLATGPGPKDFVMRHRRSVLGKRLRRRRRQRARHGHPLGRAGRRREGYDAHGKCIVSVDARYFRPTEVETCWATQQGQEQTGWTPKISFAELVAEMVREDLKLPSATKL